MAMCAYASGNLDEALQFANTALAIDPTFEAARHNVLVLTA